jgi:hypothetical protein
MPLDAQFYIEEWQLRPENWWLPAELLWLIKD